MRVEPYTRWRDNEEKTLRKKKIALLKCEGKPRASQAGLQGEAWTATAETGERSSGGRFREIKE